MAKAKGTNAADAATMEVKQGKDESGGMALARDLLEPHIRHAHTVSVFNAPLLAGSSKKPGLMDYAEHVVDQGVKAQGGDLALVSRLLVSQALTLDSMFTEFARRAAANMGEYVQTAERYGRLAMKAQSNSRATLEALAKLHQPREQTVRHVHVGRGGQAVVADEFHHHTGGQENAVSAEQSHTPADSGPALPSPDPLGNGMPITSGSRQAALPHARRH